MVNVEMVRMSALDKKLSNPSKPSGKKTADFSRLISEKTADVKDAGAPQPDGKVQEKENCGKTEPEDRPMRMPMICRPCSCVRILRQDLNGK